MSSATNNNSSSCACPRWIPVSLMLRGPWMHYHTWPTHAIQPSCDHLMAGGEVKLWLSLRTDTSLWTNLSLVIYVMSHAWWSFLLHVSWQVERKFRIIAGDNPKFTSLISRALFQITYYLPWLMPSSTTIFQ